MAKSKQAIKSRIRSIKATQKITGAMELVAVSKMKRQQNLWDGNSAYAKQLSDIVKDILRNSNSVENQYLIKQEDTHPLTVVFCSDVGLCGSFNMNILKFLLEKVKSGEEVLIIGSKIASQILKAGYQGNKEVIHSDSLNYAETTKIMDGLLKRYLKKEITSIQVIYTKYINSMSFVPTFEKLLPVDSVEKGSTQEIIYEPSANAILNDIVPMYVRSTFYSMWLHSTLSEQTSRRMAMDTANDNAEELIESLTLQFNQARQAAITQEITEIVSAADAV